MRRLPLILTLLIPACAAASPLEEGDRQFRLGRYDLALESYQLAAEGQPDSELLQARIGSARHELVLLHARELLHLEQPYRVLEVLQTAEGMRPGSPYAAALRDRAHRKIGADYAEEGRDFFSAEQPSAALQAFTQALAYDPDNAIAVEGLELSQQRLDAQERLGEEYFILGLEELEAGIEDRARTAFEHAATQWGDHTRAGELLEEVSVLLAQRSRLQAAEYLDLGLIGPAWMALRDADHLAPGDPEVEARLAELENSMLADLDLDSAELAILGGYPARALEAVSAALERDAQGLEGRTEQLRLEAEALAGSQRYVRARMCEMDGLTARSVKLLEEIVALGIPGFEDVPARLEQAKQRLAGAEASYREALEAEGAGDLERYLEKLRETVRLARDYQDASQRLRLLTARAGD